MEQSNKTQRSEVWEQIYKVVRKIPRKDIVDDAPDAPSVATELEELFLKLLPIHDVSKRSEQLIAFLEWKHNTILEEGLSFEELVDRYNKSN